MQDEEIAVRRMLHAARKPAVLARMQLVADLCAVTGISSPTAMIRFVINATFGPQPDERLMRDLLVQCDVEGALKQTAFAYRSGLSRRRFDARRVEAIRRIVAHVRSLLSDRVRAGDGDLLNALGGALLALDPAAACKVYVIVGRGGTPSSKVAALRARVDSGEALTVRDAAGLNGSYFARGLAIVAQSMFLCAAEPAELECVIGNIWSVLDAAAPSDPSTLFELEWLNFLSARSQNRMPAMAASAANLRRLAGECVALKRRATLASAWSFARWGQVERARHVLSEMYAELPQPLDVHELGLAQLIEAELDLLEERDRSAKRHARGAYLVLAPRYPEGSWAATLLARIDTDREADIKRILQFRKSGSWEYAAALAILSRLLLLKNDLVAAASVAEEGRLVSQDRYPGLLAHFLATAGAAADLQQKRETAQRLYREAMLAFAGIYDRVCAVDLFDIPLLPQRAFGPLSCIDPIVEALLLRLEHAFPNIRGAVRDAWIEFLHELVVAAYAQNGGTAAVMRRALIADEIAANRLAFDEAVALGAAMVLPRAKRVPFVESVRRLTA